MNNTINRIKKRADTLVDYIVNKVERLEAENHQLSALLNNGNLELRTHELAFKKALDKITEIKKKGGDIIITFKGKNNNGDMDTLYTHFTQDEPLYPLAEMLLGKYEKRKEFGKLIKKGWIKPIEEL